MSGSWDLVSGQLQQQIDAGDYASQNQESGELSSLGKNDMIRTSAPPPQLPTDVTSGSFGDNTMASKTYNSNTQPFAGGKSSTNTPDQEDTIQGSEQPSSDAGGQYFTGGNSPGDQIGGTEMTESGMVDMSDKRNKKNIKNSSDIDDFIKNLHPKSFRYKDKSNGTPSKAGIMAQDLEKSKIGKSIVINTPKGKMVDIGKLSTAMAGIFSSKIKSLEDQMKEIKKDRK